MGGDAGGAVVGHGFLCGRGGVGYGGGAVVGHGFLWGMGDKGGGVVGIIGVRSEGFL